MDDDVLESYRTAGRIAREARTYGASLAKEGYTILEVAEKTEKHIRKRGGHPAFPVNVAVDDVAAHYTPHHNERGVFVRGNIVKVDVGVHVNGYIGDTATTVEVGTRNWTDLIRASEHALETAVELVKPRVQMRMIGGAIERAIESWGYKPVSNLTGHSMERFSLHAGKSIPNVLDSNTAIIKEGDVLAIEPFATNGAGKVTGKKGGNIYRLLRVRELKNRALSNLLRSIEESFSMLPFAERWCLPFDSKASYRINKLVRLGALYSYPLLRDGGGGMVSQAEHTVIVTESGCEVIT
ncbi:MAG: type II methionyl aminopeptidase [Thermoplasmata archaeon]